MATLKYCQRVYYTRFMSKRETDNDKNKFSTVYLNLVHLEERYSVSSELSYLSDTNSDLEDKVTSVMTRITTQVKEET